MPNTTDYLPPPPRSVPILEQLALLCSGVTAFLGWMFLGMGLLFSFLFVGQSEATLLFRFDGPWLWGKGLVSDIRTTNMAKNEQIVYAIDFQYQVDGQSYQATSYSTYARPAVGDSLDLEYKEARPARARLEGTSEKPFSAWVAFMLLFPLIGLGFVLASLRRNFRLVRLLRQGQLTRGILKNKKATNTQINNRTVYAYAFEFRHQRQMYIARGKTHKTHLLEDEERERILFSPKDPSYNIVYDAYAYAPKISPQGNFKSLPLRVYGGLATVVFWTILNISLLSYLLASV